MNNLVVFMNQGPSYSGELLAGPLLRSNLCIYYAMRPVVLYCRGTTLFLPDDALSFPLEFKFSVTKLYPAISTLDLTCPLLLLFIQGILVIMGFSKVQSDFFCNPFLHTHVLFQRGISINLYLFVFVDTFIREHPLMTFDFGVGRGVQNDPKYRTF